ncbi:uncharacterized protein LOC122027511 [Zingiber officinale]|uniref:Uncharacterized protein n=1 Tax=Zingiber officinale TaxID=94328 RepID=A0A8J5CDH9_ZINOF|nr:uncharacterized protein LOC122027511 [Zingiber officinale]XP_042442438.1 uncharacterized protein LOC122027511 [Zingiber officinale]KAG6473274.1 hypothetical protein ZIOFF_067188 [Zingiber officinale]
MAFARFSIWIWGRKDHESANSTLVPPEFPSGFKEAADYSNVHRTRSNWRRNKKNLQNRKERRIDKEYDIVLVPSDGGCISGSESDDSDWSIGWSEPHGPEFESDSEAEKSFAVLVRCYGRGRNEQAKNSRTHVLGAVSHMDDDLSDGNKRMEEWLSSL